ncbi:MAG: hypothetical protein ABEJ88_07155, partial [Halobacterium sp.]
VSTVTDSPSSAPGSGFGVLPAVAVVLGAFVVGYALLLVQSSVLAAVHAAAIGAALALSGGFASAWAGRRFGLTQSERRKLSALCFALAAMLTVSYVALNYATFEAGSSESGGTAALAPVRVA